jgi:hypothetical protein
MPSSYFETLVARTPTRVWVNNPTSAEVEMALEQHAVGCTTNPTFGASLLRRQPDEIRPIIGECVDESDDDERVAELVQERLVARIAERFMPLHQSSEGRLGFVSIQGSPVLDEDPTHILAEAREAVALGLNVAPKIPATAPGLAAFEVLVAEGRPTIVTEVFSLAQLVETCERYLAVSSRVGHRPPFFLSPITGIFGDHLRAITPPGHASDLGKDMDLAGVALSRACLRMVEERDYPVTLLCGGARNPFDLTGLVGGPVHATINWSTFAEVLASPEPFLRGIDEPIEEQVLERLATTFDDFGRAMTIDGLTLAEFEGFGPVQHFRNAFISGWSQLRGAIAARREALVRL